MGNNSSTELQSTITAYTEYINNVSNDIVNTSLTQCVASNYINFSLGGPPCKLEGGVYEGIKIDFEQTAKGECNLTSQNASSITIDFSATISEATQNFVDAQSEVEGSWLQTSINSNSQNIKTTTELTALITNNFKSSITNTCATQIEAANHGDVVLCGNFKNVDYKGKQNAAAMSITSCINENIIDAYNTNATLRKVVNETESVMSTKEKSILGDFIKYFAILSIVSIVVGAIVTIVYYFSGAGKTTTVTKRTKPATGSVSTSKAGSGGSTTGTGKGGSKVGAGGGSATGTGTGGGKTLSKISGKPMESK